MGTTSAGLRYPEPTDRVADGAAAIRSLAEDVTALGRARLIKVAGATGEVTTSTTAGAWTDLLNVDFVMPASVPSSDSTAAGGVARLVLLASVDGMWTGGHGGPSWRWLLNGNQQGQVRTSQAPQNAYTSASLFDWGTAPAAGSSNTLRLQHMSGSTTVCRSRWAVAGVFLC